MVVLKESREDDIGNFIMLSCIIYIRLQSSHFYILMSIIYAMIDVCSYLSSLFKRSKTNGKSDNRHIEKLYNLDFVS